MEVYEPGAHPPQGYRVQGGFQQSRNLAKITFASQLAQDQEQQHEDDRSMTVPALRSKLITTIAPARIPEF